MPSQVKVPAILGTIDYKYSATGERLEASYKWHSGLSLDPQENLNRPTYTATNSSKLRQYAGNKVYENGSLKRILLDNGYIEGGIYYFYLRDHLGNNSVVAKANGQVVQRSHYYPYGKVIGNGESSGQAAQPYKFHTPNCIRFLVYCTTFLTYCDSTLVYCNATLADCDSTLVYCETCLTYCK